MPEDLPIEQRIANFLDTHNITIVPETRGEYEALGYVQHTPTGIVDLGETVYDQRTGHPQGVPGEVAMKRHQVQGFVTEVTRPLARLLLQTQGQFYENKRWEPIHAACDLVEARHR